MEDEVSPPTLNSQEVSIPEAYKYDHPKPSKPISLQEMPASQFEDLECQQYTAAIGLLTSPFHFRKDLILVRSFPLEGAIKSFAFSTRCLRKDTEEKRRLTRGYAELSIPLSWQGTYPVSTRLQSFFQSRG